MACLASPLYAAEDIWVDVRSDKEWDSGHLDGAVHIPHTEITEKIVSLTEDKNAPIKLYCRSGGRAGMAKKELEKMGYTNVTNVGGLKDAEKAVKNSE
ncbi:MAG: rhodanese-like domain-containing protein [Cellvibrionaceae bacterium]